MRRVGFVLLVLVTALATVSCDTSQPAQAGPTTVEVQIDGRGLVNIFDCYDRFNNGVMDRISCFPAAGTSVADRVIPWAYSFRIIILRAGETLPDILAGSVNDPTFEVFGNVTRFDPISETGALRPPDGTFTYENARRVSAGHVDFFRGWVDFGGGNVRAPIPVPEVNILQVPPATAGESPRYAFELNTGDAIFVEAAKQLTQFGPNMFPGGGQVPSIELSGQLFVAGAPTSPSAGTFISERTRDGAGFSFQYISD
jgi:hypothetical protein